MGNLTDSDRSALIASLGLKYLWWERQRIDAIPTRRIIAQVMNIGTYEDIALLVDAVGNAPLIDALTNALPGWFRPRSWSYWHVRLGLLNGTIDIPPMPMRTYK